jgi:protein ImuB
LLSPPELLIGASSEADAPPTEFVFENRRQRVLGHWGPERLESGWWRGPSTRREYFRVETVGGDWWWIFRDAISGAWYIHGLFG